MSESKKRPKPNRTDHVGIQFFTSQALVDALDGYIASLPPDKRPTKKGVIEGAIMKYLYDVGAWPPPEPEPKLKRT